MCSLERFSRVGTEDDLVGFFFEDYIHSLFFLTVFPSTLNAAEATALKYPKSSICLHMAKW